MKSLKKRKNSPSARSQSAQLSGVRRLAERRKRKLPKRKRRKILTRETRGTRETRETRETEKKELVHKTKIRVIGVGGGGNSIVSEIAQKIRRLDFVAANTDRQALRKLSKDTKLFQFGQSLTEGLGCGMDPQLGEKAAREEEDKIKKLFEGIDLSVLVSTLGGGTGSGASSVFAEIAKGAKNITLGIFTIPFKFEGEKKAKIAEEALEKIKPNLSALILIPNEKIFQVIDQNTPFKDALSAVNERLAESLGSLIETLYLPGLINIDFADLKTIFEGRGRLGYLNSVEVKGPGRAAEAVKKVLRNPLIDYDIRGADKILFNIVGRSDLKMAEVEEISRTIWDYNKRAKIIFGISQGTSSFSKNKKNSPGIRITLLAVGCQKGEDKIGAKKLKKKKKKEKLLLPSVPPVRKISAPRRKKKRNLPSAPPTGGRRRGQPAIINKKVTPPESISKKIKVKTATEKKEKDNSLSSVPSSDNNDSKVRRSAIDLKKESEKIEKEILEEEKKWDFPAFLRKKLERNK